MDIIAVFNGLQELNSVHSIRGQTCCYVFPVYCNLYNAKYIIMGYMIMLKLHGFNIGQSISFVLA